MTQGAIAEAWSDRTMSLEEWAAMPEDEPGELVDGLLVEEEDVGYAHEVVVGWFIQMLRLWVVARGGFVATSDAKFAVKRNRGRKPDVTVYLPGRKPPSQGLIRIPPDIAVEVVSPTPRDGRRDRVEKVKEYAAFGVRWYWIVDPQLRSLEIYELGADGRYAYALGATDGVLESVPGCEGLTLDVNALWSEIDRLGITEAKAPAEPEE
jgi:Uma2 family endonuclease